MAFTSPKSKRDVEPVGSGIMMDLLRGLVMTHSERKGELLQEILNFLLLQDDILGAGATDKDDLLQIEYNMKLSCIFVECAMQTSAEARYLKSLLQKPMSSYSEE